MNYGLFRLSISVTVLAVQLALPSAHADQEIPTEPTAGRVRCLKDTVNWALLPSGELLTPYQASPVVFQTVNGIRKWLRPPLVAPKALTSLPGHLVTHKVFSNKTSFDPKSVRLRFTGLGGYPERQHPAIVAHEYGHSILFKNLDLPEDPFPRNDVTEIARTRFITSKYDIDRLRRQAGMPRNPSAEENMDKSIDRDRHLERQSVFYQIRTTKWFSGLDEFFADVTGVVHLGQGDAYKFVGRDFTQYIDPVGYESRGGTGHDVYMPARTYIWRHYLEDLPLQKRSDVLQACLNAISSEVDRILGSG